MVAALRIPFEGIMGEQQESKENTDDVHMLCYRFKAPDKDMHQLIFNIMKQEGTEEILTPISPDVPQ